MPVTADVQQAIDQAIASALGAVSSVGTAANVGGAQASEVTETLQKSIASLTEQLTKQQSEGFSRINSQTDSLMKQLDVGADESASRGVVDADNEWSSINRHRASLLARSAGIIDLAMSNAVFATNIAQLSLVREFDQQGAHNWRKRCGEPPANPAEVAAKSG